MIEAIDTAAAKDFVINKLQNGDYGFLEKSKLDAIVTTCLALDEQFMETSGVNTGEAYDDDKAYEHIFEGLTKAFPELKMYCMRLTEDYMDAFEGYLEESGVLEWDDDEQ